MSKKKRGQAVNTLGLENSKYRKITQEKITILSLFYVITKSGILPLTGRTYFSLFSL